MSARPRCSLGLRPIPPNGTDPRARFCGPTALSAVTHRPPETFVTWPNRRRKGMRHAQVLAALKLLCGLRATLQMFTGRRLPLWRFCRADRRGIVAIRGHYLAVDGFMVCDTQSPRGTWVHDHPHRGARVRAFISVPEVSK